MGNKLVIKKSPFMWAIIAFRWLVIAIAIAIAALTFTDDGQSIEQLSTEDEVLNSEGFSYATAAVKDLFEKNDFFIEIKSISWVDHYHGVAVKIDYNEDHTKYYQFHENRENGKMEIKETISANDYNSRERVVLISQFDFFKDADNKSVSRERTYNDYAVSVIVDYVRGE